MHDYLKKLVENKKVEVKALKAELKHNISHDIHDVLNGDKRFSSSKSFKNALKKSSGIIAEIKRRSPSKDKISEIPDPVNLAKQYVEGGAAAISVLTDAYGFGGSIDDLKNVSKALSNSRVPVLRKDFIIDPIQIAEAIVAGADAILLIVAVLQEKTAGLLNDAKSLGIEAMLEVTNSKELEIALQAGAEIIDVNNRDLVTFDVNPNCAIELISDIPTDIVRVAASGMDSPKIAAHYIQEGYDAVLVGEALVKSGDPKHFIQSFRVLV